jgi:hydroxymethylglutaryl-CoA lyase
VAYLVSIGIEIIPLSDITGDVSPKTIRSVFEPLRDDFPETEFGVHLHCTPVDYFGKVDAAWESGVRRFDTVLGGIGGCPFAGDHLVSNLDTRSLVKYLISIGYDFKLNLKEMEKALGVFLGT